MIISWADLSDANEGLFNGPVRAPQEWAFVKVPDAPVEFLYHKRGEGFKAAAAALGAK